MTLAAALLAVLAIVVVAVFWNGDDDGLVVNQPQDKGAGGPSGVEADPEHVIVGGVRRKASDVRPVKQTRPHEQPADTFDPGRTEPVPPDTNPQVASVMKALRDKEHPERLSTIIQPEAFNAAAFAQDPQAYLDIVEPGRVYQTAQPGPGVAVLKALTARRLEINQGESVKLKVRAAAQAPVTFTSFDLGAFQNQLNSITVQADSQGLAEAEFFGSPGTFSDVNILAGSPVTTGQVKFVVNVVVSQ